MASPNHMKHDLCNGSVTKAIDITKLVMDEKKWSAYLTEGVYDYVLL